MNPMTKMGLIHPHRRHPHRRPRRHLRHHLVRLHPTAARKASPAVVKAEAQPLAAAVVVVRKRRKMVKRPPPTMSIRIGVILGTKRRIFLALIMKSTLELLLLALSLFLVNTLFFIGCFGCLFGCVDGSCSVVESGHSAFLLLIKVTLACQMILFDGH